MLQQPLSVHVVLEKSVRQIGVHPARSQRIHPHAALGPIQSERTRQHFYTALRGAIWYRAKQPDMARHGTDVYDRAPAMIPHRLPNVLAAEEGAGEIDVD